jgi:UDP-N-acetylglucosamine 2-epimerase (non-hydrolysing)
MLTGAFAAFDLVPDRDLDLMREAQSQPALIGSMLPGVAAAITELRPDRVVVQGDTCTTLVGALAGFLARVPVAHVEAGLRTGNLDAPFPEEGYRRMVADLATLHFAPTAQAMENLRAEGVDGSRIHLTGNTAIDALRMVLARPSPPPDCAAHRRIAAAQGHPYVLVTCHRRESFGADMQAVMHALATLARTHVDVNFVFPVHLNPAVRELVHASLGIFPNVLLCAPLDYARFAHLLAGCRFVMTDSGGIQEEAADLGRPVLVLRRTTERAEGVAAGTAQLVGVDPAAIVAAATSLLTDEAHYRRYAVPAHVYGDGRAAEAIAALLAGAVPAHHGSA